MSTHCFIQLCMAIACILLRTVIMIHKHCTTLQISISKQGCQHNVCTTNACVFQHIHPHLAVIFTSTCHILSSAHTPFLLFTYCDCNRKTVAITSGVTYFTTSMRKPKILVLKSQFLINLTTFTSQSLLLPNLCQHEDRAVYRLPSLAQYPSLYQ